MLSGGLMAAKRKRTIEYDYFFSALKHFLGAEERGKQVSLHQETKIAEGTISAIVNEKRMATFEQQIKIAKAFKMDYLEFMALGKSTIAGQRPVEKPPEKNQTESINTLVKAAEAFCTVLAEEAEKVKTKKKVSPGQVPAATVGVAGSSG